MVHLSAGRVAVLALAISALLSCDASRKTSATPTATTSNTAMQPKPDIKIQYPVTRRDANVRDNYHGETLTDPYRWLESDTSAETKDWVRRQNKVTFDYLANIPYRGFLKARLEQIWNFEKFGTPFKKAGKYYFFKNDGLQNQSVLYVQDNLDGDAVPRVVLDPNTFSKEGTTSLQELDFSKNGRFLAYTISKGGSDWRSILVKNLETGQMLPDQIEWAKFTGLAWTGDGFYYTRYPEPAQGMALTAANQNSAIYYHKLGTPQSRDELVYNDPAHPNYYFGAGTTDDERFLFVTGSESTSGNSLYIRDLTQAGSSLVPVVTNFENEHSVIDNLGDKLIVLTNLQAPNQRVVLVDPTSPAPANWKSLIPEDPADVLQSASVCGDRLVCSYLHNAASSLRIFSLPDGKLVREVKLPEIGTVVNVSGEKGENQAFFSFQSFLRPTTIYSLDMQALDPKVFKAPQTVFNPDHFVTEQLWYTSKDGTRVPMFVTHRKDMRYDGQNPTLLYGYGGFNISLTPGFSASRALLLEQGGVYAVANLRGGGEFGEKWHKAGTKCQKQNVFDDFIAAAEYLTKNKITSRDRLAIEGGSNGGLLVGAAMTQRPDLFGVAFPRVGVLDMLRYHLFTIGYAWAVDYGRSDNPDEYKCLRAYSPLHNLRNTEYPATMITTADHDDRVVPAHSFKFAAGLQAVQQGTNPALIRIETAAGHGAGKPTSKLLEEAADMMSFMFYNMGVTVKTKEGKVDKP